MASEFTRQELKTDKFAVNVEHAAEYAVLHKSQFVRIGALVLLMAAVTAGVVFWRNAQADHRRDRLAQAMALQEAPVTPLASDTQTTFPTEQAKKDAVAKAFNEVAQEYPNSHEGHTAAYSLGAALVADGKLDEGKKKLQAVADSGDDEMASLAKLAIAQIDFTQNLTADAERILRGLIDHPTDLVSKEQATLTLARGLAKTRPADARKLIEPLRTSPGEVGADANQFLADLSK